MRTLPSLGRRHLAALLFASLTTVALSAQPEYVSESRLVSAATTQEQIRSVKPGKYPGRISFTDRNKNRVDGKATLEVSNGQRFSLTDDRNVRRGALVTRINGYPGGYIQFDEDRRISIKWTQDAAKPARLKIVNAKGECIEFRFCSDEVSDEECRRSLRLRP